ncbi:MAG: NUDIX hydrolase [Nanoarchaeota archaeon]
MKLRLNANAVVTNLDGKFLLVELKKGPFRGRLCIPGGGVEPGEMSFDAVKREVFEETGIEISDFDPSGFCELIHKGIGSHRVVMLLEGCGDGEPKETEEGFARWLSYDEAKEKLIPFARESIRIWKEGEKYFKLIEGKT